MNAHAKPKQFLELHGKPIILYTLEHFEMHPEIDKIIVVCIENWINDLCSKFRQYEFKKVIEVIPGGREGYDSIYNGLHALECVCKPDDIVLIHDGVRPLINAELISASIAKVKEHGTAITVEAVTESVVRLNGNDQIAEIPPREKMYTAKAPQSFRYGLIWDLYQRAHNAGIGTIDSAHLCSIYGVELHTIKSSPNNVKITSPTDYFIFRALYEAMENEQIFGIQ